MGDNLIEKSANMGWWKGLDMKVEDKPVHIDTLLDALDKFVQLPKRDDTAPLRIPVSGMHTHTPPHTDTEYHTVDLYSPACMHEAASSCSATCMCTRVCCASCVYVCVCRLYAGNYQIKGVGTVITGRIEQGSLKPGDEVHTCTHSARSMDAVSA